LTIRYRYTTTSVRGVFDLYIKWESLACSTQLYSLWTLTYSTSKPSCHDITERTFNIQKYHLFSFVSIFKDIQIVRCSLTFEFFVLILTCITPLVTYDFRGPLNLVVSIYQLKNMKIGIQRIEMNLQWSFNIAPHTSGEETADPSGAPEFTPAL
jgi:hypothetical protein